MTLEEEPVRAGGGWKGVGSCATVGFAFFFLIKFILFVCMCECAHASLYIWRSEDNLSRLVLSFHCGDARDQSQVARLGHCPPNHHSIRPVTILSDDALSFQ